MSKSQSIFDEVTLPSPVRRLNWVGNGATLWVKDDSRIHDVYGGNKCRKLAHILRDAERRSKTRIVTFGTAGSHHVLATGLLGKTRGFAVRAFIVSQPWSMHAEEVLRASAASGVELVPARSTFGALKAASQMLDGKCTLVPPGGSNMCGSLGYFDAALELARQIEKGELPEPDYIVLAFGTGGTAAGLLAGAEFAGLKSRIVGVSVLRGAGRALYARWLANAILGSIGSSNTVKPDRLIVDSRWLGSGYGVETESGKVATEEGAALDLPLDPSYTAKAFAGALALMKGSKSSFYDDQLLKMPVPSNHVLYWHTLSAPGTLHRSAANATILPRNLRDLLRPCSRS